jgi:hypothetical protein
VDGMATFATVDASHLQESTNRSTLVPMGSPKLKITAADKRRSEREVFNRIKHRTIPYVSVGLDGDGKILAVGVNHEAVARKMERLGLQGEIVSHQVEP